MRSCRRLRRSGDATCRRPPSPSRGDRRQAEHSSRQANRRIEPRHPHKLALDLGSEDLTSLDDSRTASPGPGDQCRRARYVDQIDHDRVSSEIIDGKGRRTAVGTDRRRIDDQIIALHGEFRERCERQAQQSRRMLPTLSAAVDQRDDRTPSTQGPGDRPPGTAAADDGGPSPRDRASTKVGEDAGRVGRGDGPGRPPAEDEIRRVRMTRRPASEGREGRGDLLVRRGDGERLQRSNRSGPTLRPRQARARTLRTSRPETGGTAPDNPGLDTSRCATAETTTVTPRSPRSRRSDRRPATTVGRSPGSSVPRSVDPNARPPRPNSRRKPGRSQARREDPAPQAHLAVGVRDHVVARRRPQEQQGGEPVHGTPGFHDQSISSCGDPREPAESRRQLRRGGRRTSPGDQRFSGGIAARTSSSMSRSSSRSMRS